MADFENKLIKNIAIGTYTPGEPGDPGHPGTPPTPGYSYSVTEEQCTWVQQYESGYCKDIVQLASPEVLEWLAGMNMCQGLTPYAWVTVPIFGSSILECEEVTYVVTVPPTPGTPPIPGTAPTAGELQHLYNLGWNSGAISETFFDHNGQVTFFSGRNQGSVIGISTAPVNVGEGLAEIEHGFYTAISGSNAIARVYESGVAKTGWFQFSSENDEFKIRRVNGLIEYFIGGTLVYTSATLSFGRARLDVSFYRGGDYIFNYEVGDTFTGEGNAILGVPYRSNQFMFVFGTGYMTIYAFGDANLAPLEASGTGTLGTYGAGSATLRPLTAAGAEIPANGGVGVATIEPLSVSGSGTLGDYGIAVLPELDATGFGFFVEGYAAGDVILPALTATGTGNVIYGGTGSVVFEPLEVFASEGPQAEGYIILDPLDASGTGGWPVPSINEGYAPMLPMWVIGTGFTNPTGNGNAVLPALDALGWEGTGRGQGFIDLQPLSAYGGKGSSYAVAPFGNFGITAEGSEGQLEGVQKDFFNMEFEGQFGGKLAEPSYVPPFELEMEATIDPVGRLEVEFHNHVLNATGLIGAIGTATLELRLSHWETESASGWHVVTEVPGFELIADGRAGRVGSTIARVPPFILEASGSQGFVGRGAISLEPLTITATLQAVMYVPPLFLAAEGGELIATPVIVGYSINLQNAALTGLTQFPFREIIRFNDKYYGVNESGVFELNAGTDQGGVDLDAMFRLSELDFNSPRDKKLVRAYVSYRADGDLKPFTVADEDTRIDYTLPDNISSKYRTRRVVLAKGPKALKWGFGIENVDGSSMDIDDIELVAQILKRRVR